MYVCLADLMLAIGLIGGALSLHQELGCKCFAVLVNLSFLGLCFWSLCLVIALYRILRSDRNVRQYELYFHMVGWGVPVLLTGALCWLGKLGRSGGWCWVEPENISSYRWVYIPLLTATILAIVLVICTYRMLSRVVNPQYSPVKGTGEHCTTGHWETSLSELLSHSDNLLSLPCPAACSDVDTPSTDYTLDDPLGHPTVPQTDPISPQVLTDQLRPCGAHAISYDRSAVRNLLRYECRTSHQYLWYTASFVFVVLPCCSNHFYHEYTNHEGKMDEVSAGFGLAMVQAFVQPLHGLLSFIIFSLNRNMLVEYRERFGLGVKKDVRQPLSVENKRERVDISAMQQQLTALQEQIVLLQQARESVVHGTLGSTPGSAVDLKLDLDKAVTALKAQTEQLSQQMLMAEMSGQF